MLLAAVQKMLRVVLFILHLFQCGQRFFSHAAAENEEGKTDPDEEKTGK